MTARARAITIGADGMAEGRHGNTEAQRAAAARVVAAMSGGAEECAELLAMLGLSPAEGVSPPQPQRSAPAPRRRRVARGR